VAELSGMEPEGLFDQLVKACVRMVVAAFLIYCAISLLKAVWLWIVIICGTAGLLWVGIVVFKTWHDRL
jgi:hypothetical protein